MVIITDLGMLMDWRMDANGFRYVSLGDLAIPKKMAKLFTKRPWSDPTFHGIWSESALFASYPFVGLQTKIG